MKGREKERGKKRKKKNKKREKNTERDLQGTPVLTTGGWGEVGWPEEQQLLPRFARCGGRAPLR